MSYPSRTRGSLLPVRDHQLLPESSCFARRNSRVYTILHSNHLAPRRPFTETLMNHVNPVDARPQTTASIKQNACLQTFPPQAEATVCRTDSRTEHRILRAGPNECSRG